MSPLRVDEASASYESAMRNPLAAGPGICEVCHTFIDPQYSRCYPCMHQHQWLDAVVPISYSEHGGQLHLALRGYKDGYSPAERGFATPRLAAILWYFLEAHERCVADAVGVDRFDVVTTVPSSTPERDEARGNLRWIVSTCEPINARFERVLRATGRVPEGRDLAIERYRSERLLTGETVLLIDDTWTTGGHAQSAAAALKAAGATTVALVVIGRHVKPWWVPGPGPETVGELLGLLPKPFDWTSCVREEPTS